MNWIRTVKSVLLSPSAFFKKMKTKGSYRDPLRFTACNYLVSGAFFGLLSLNPLSFFIALAFFPLAGVAGVFVNSTLYHIFIRMLGGKGTFKATARVLSYSSAAAIFSWIPFINVFTEVYALYLYVIGFSRVHRISMIRSFFAVFLPMFLAVAVILSLTALFSPYLEAYSFAMPV